MNYPLATVKERRTTGKTKEYRKKMKKTILIIVIAVLALGAFGVGAVLAQGQQPPQWGGMMGGRGGGWMHDYVEKALADKLGITEQQVEDALASGKSMYQVALDNGTAEADVPALMTEVHKAAFDAAISDGVVSKDQADWMLQRMQGMWANGGPGANGTCPMHNGNYGPQGGQGFRGGPGGMMGGRWQNQ
jgi:hypothetical protein